MGDSRERSTEERQRPEPAGTSREPRRRRYYEPLEPDYLADLVTVVLRPIVEHYFRPRLLGGHRIPPDGPAILASNHSGTAFPYDGMILDYLLWRRRGSSPKVRPVFEKELSAVWWMRPFGIDNFWRRGGGVDMTFDNFHRLLERGERVLYYPEGVPGIGKGFQRRYQLQRFSSSFVIQAARHRAPVVPIYSINAEWVIPFNFTLGWVDRLIQRLFHVPFLPLPAGPLGILFPWMWYLSLPSRMIFVTGEPLDVAALVREEGEEDLDAPDRERMRAVAERVRRAMQAELDTYVERYGRWPYQARSLLHNLRVARRNGRLAGSLPLFWPLTFVRHHRDRHRPPAKNRLHAWLRDFDLAAYYLPFGWPLLTLARRLRKPPCGYRGLSPKERRELEGTFVWHLSERPLPPREGTGQPARGPAEDDALTEVPDTPAAADDAGTGLSTP